MLTDEERITRGRLHGRENMRERRKANPEKVKLYMTECRKNDRDKVKANLQRWFERQRDEIVGENKKWAEANPEKMLRYKYNWCVRKRDEVLAFLGGKCIRCGFTDVRALQIDHVDGNGYKHRKSYKGLAYYQNIKNHIENKTMRFQLLCANCNFIKGIERKERGCIWN